MIFSYYSYLPFLHHNLLYLAEKDSSQTGQIIMNNDVWHVLNVAWRLDGNFRRR